jgi:hypothetical protein
MTIAKIFYRADISHDRAKFSTRKYLPIFLFQKKKINFGSILSRPRVFFLIFIDYKEYKENKKLKTLLIIFDYFPI